MQRALPRNAGPSSSDDTANPLGPMEATLSCLWVLTPLTATVSLLVVIVAMFTNQWLHTEEKMNNPSYNGTGEKDYLSKLTISGLWMFCFTNPSIPFIPDGLQYGWSAPIIPPLKYTESPITLTGDEVWLDITYILPAVIGIFITPFLVDKMGPQKSVLLASGTSLIAWTTIAAATRIEFLYLGRFLACLASELSFIIVPIYITEISSKEIRGFLIQQIHIMFFSGLIIIYSMDSFVPFYVPSGVIAGSLLVQIGIFLLMPESPYYLVAKDQQKPAKIALKKLQLTGHNYKAEFDRLSSAINHEMEEYDSWQDILWKKKNRKVLIICATLLTAQHFCGVISIIMNLHLILIEAESDYMQTGAEAVTYYLVVTLVTSVVCSFFIDMFERKALLIFSYISSALSLLLLAIYFNLKRFDIDLERVNLVPVCCIFAFGVFNNFGLATIPRILAPELFTFRVRRVGLVVCEIVNIVCQSLALVFFDYVNYSYGMFVSFYAFSGMCFLGAIFTAFCVPKTKQKSLEEIQNFMNL